MLMLSGSKLIVWVLVFLISASNYVKAEFNASEPDGWGNCSTRLDNTTTNAQDNFLVMEWIQRGTCLRGNSTSVCYSRLDAFLSVKLGEIRKAEYAGAAGVLALLPTVGALLGVPTNEVWKLLTLIPFGGALAMAMSFGGAILPVQVHDYETNFSKRKTTIGYILRSDSRINIADKTESNEKIQFLRDMAVARLRRKEKKHMVKSYIVLGLIGMLVLLLSAHISMIIVEQGSIVPWWCSSRWWMHLWYFMVIFTAILDNWVQLPFKKQHKLYVSDIPYDIRVVGGDDITQSLSENGEEADNVFIALRQLGTLKPASLELLSSAQRSSARNAIFIMVSVTDSGNERISAFFKSTSKLMSIGVFIVGTALFASVQLLSIAMVVFVLTLVLAAGVFGRTIASWIVSGIEAAEPMIHYVASSEQEASRVIAMVLGLSLNPESDSEVGVSSQYEPRKLQVEIQGHIFVDGRRICRRSPWPVRMFGIIASPFDISTMVNLKARTLGSNFYTSTPTVVD